MDPFTMAALATVGSGLLTSRATKKARKAQAKELEAQRKAWEAFMQQARFDMAPYKNYGSMSVARLSDLFNNPQSFEADPGYQFRFGQGQKAIENSARARGSLDSGRTLKELMRYGQDYGTQEYGNVFQRLMTGANMGQNAIGSLTGAAGQGMNALTNIGGQMGNVNAASRMGQTNVLTETLNDLLGLWSDKQMMDDELAKWRTAGAPFAGAQRQSIYDPNIRNSGNFGR